MTRTPKLNRRYYLHKRVKKLGIRVAPTKNTLFVDHPDKAENKAVKELQDIYHYSVQTYIPC